MKNKVSLFLAVLFFLATSNCSRGVDVEAETASLRKLDMELLKSAEEKDLETFLSVHADDIYTFVPGAPVFKGKEATRPHWTQLFSSPGFELSWQLDKVEVSSAGDLAYETGTYVLTTKGPNGKLVTDRGQFVAIFKKQPDGQWKQVIDIWNSTE